MVCQRCRGLLETFDDWGIETDSLYTATTLPHAASIAGVSRMPSFVRIASAIRRERQVSHRGAEPSSASVDPIMLDCECSSYQNYDGGAFVGQYLYNLSSLRRRHTI